MTARKKPSGGVTAAELMALKAEKLRTDPAYRAQTEAVEAERQERSRELRRAEQPIVADLRAARVDVESVWDLVNTSEPYPDALPILLNHLQRGGYPDRVMESLGRALAVNPAAPAWETAPARDANGLHPSGAGECSARGEGEEALTPNRVSAARPASNSIAVWADPERRLQVWFVRWHHWPLSYAVT